MYRRSEIQKILKESGAMEIHERPINLKKGAQSSLYFDITRTYQNPKHLTMLVDGLWDMIKNRNAEHLNIDYVVSSGYGGLPLASGIACKYNIGLIPVREEEKGYGVPNTSLLDKLTSDNMVVLVDGVVTSGGSLLKMAKPFIDREVKIEGAYSVVNRNDEEFSFSDKMKRKEFNETKNEWKRTGIHHQSLYDSRILA